MFIFYLVFIVALPWVLCFLAKVAETIVYKIKLRGLRKRFKYSSGIPTNSKAIKKDFYNLDKSGTAMLLLMATVSGAIWIIFLLIIKDDLMTAIKYKN